MFLEFNVNNFKSIKDTVNFNMSVSSKDIGNSFTVQNKKYSLLNSAVIYGSNASGKSNLLKAIVFMKRIVLNKDKIILSTDDIPHEPFKLNTETENASSTFEISILVDEVKYRYGFEIDDTTVYSEWLFSSEKGKEAKLFYRDEDNGSYVNPNKFQEGMSYFSKSKAEIKVSENHLFLWKCDQEKGQISKKILNWFKKCNFINGAEKGSYINHVMEKLGEPKFKNMLTSLIKTVDVGIENLALEEKEVPQVEIEKMNLPNDLREALLSGNAVSVSLKTSHKKFNEYNNEVEDIIFDSLKEESLGTQKFIAISAPILDTLKKGQVLIIDEFDASLHPFLTKQLIKLFHNKSINTKNAQLIFATHDTNLLNSSLFRRDQIWLTEKDKYGATDVFCLSQFKKVRKTDNFERQYLQGKYGAVPYIQTPHFEEGQL